MHFPRQRLILTLAALAFLTACGPSEREFRTYREVTNRSPLPHHMLATPDPSSPPPAQPAAPSGMAPLPDGMNQPSAGLLWTAPEGWEEQPGSGVRLATFVVDGADCAIFTFPGSVGGIEANIRRWWGQLNAGTISDADLASFIEAAPAFISSGDLHGRFFDFLAILPGTADLATLVSTLDLGEHTAFIKLTGPREVILNHRDRFLQLSQSIRRDGPST
ncbi:MAG TPA: hypothetical protein PKE55_14105 [Kiritimatiellia bacterium]|nr:hypothetical protein [Kiritimatiellia bacterium]